MKYPPEGGRTSYGANPSLKSSPKVCICNRLSLFSIKQSSAMEKKLQIPIKTFFFKQKLCYWLNLYLFDTCG